MVESSSSDSMVNSLVGVESCQSPVPSSALVFKTPLTTPVKKDGASSPSSQYGSVTGYHLGLKVSRSDLYNNEHCNNININFIFSGTNDDYLKRDGRRE